MKVIKASIDLESWNIGVTCKKCKSDLEIESKDISYEYQTKGSSYRTICCLCDNYIWIDQSLIPVIVERDIIKNRYISQPSSDW